MKSPDPNASNASDQQGKPTRFSRRQLLAGTPLAALGVAISGLNLGSVTSSAAAESTEKKNSEEAPVDSSRRSEAKEEELDDFMFDIEKDGKGWTGPGGSAKEASVAEFPLSQTIVKQGYGHFVENTGTETLRLLDPVQCTDVRGNLVNFVAGREPGTASGRSFRADPGSSKQISQGSGRDNCCQDIKQGWRNLVIEGSGRLRAAGSRGDRLGGARLPNDSTTDQGTGRI